MITRLPYSPRFKAEPLLVLAQQIDLRGLICISMPLHIEAPNNGGRLICELEEGLKDDKGRPILGSALHLVAKIAWFRDRHIVTTKSRRLTNTWEPLAIFSRSKNYVINREAATKIKKGFEGREGAFDEDEFQTCIGDHWPCRNDRRDRRYLPAGIVLNCGQLGDLHPGDVVLDPYGNPGIREACGSLGWQYSDAGLANPVRNVKKSLEEVANEDDNLPGNSPDEEPDLERDHGAVADRTSDAGTGRQARASREG